MRVLNKNDLHTFEQLVQLKQPTLKKTLSAFLRKKYSTVIETERYICAVGDIPIALVAHMDTVFKEPPKDIFYDTNKNVIWSPEGLGADDRAGVFAIVQILRTNRRPHIIFTTDEEMGALGASALVSQPCPFEKLQYLIELDRRGTCDCVFYDCDNPEFTNYIEKFGFITAWGSFTDISILGPAWGVAGVNLSIGYRNEHSTSETLFVNPMLATIEKVKNMLDTPKEEIPFFKYIPFDYGHLSVHRYPIWDYNYGQDYKEYQCLKCGKFFLEEETFPVYTSEGKYENYCCDCVIEVADWCQFCGEPFKKQFDGDKFCVRCKGDLKYNDNTGRD